jgi:hypothetical protein
VKLYHVVKDDTFLVDLIDEELSAATLVTVIKERGQKMGTAFQQLRLYPAGGKEKRDGELLVFRNIKLEAGQLPEECVRETQEPIHIVPADVEPHVFFTVTVRVPHFILRRSD